MRIHAHIRRNIASRRSEGDFGISMSKIDFRGTASAFARNTRAFSGLRVQKYNSYSNEKKKESCGQLSFLRNYLIQNKLSPLLQELNFQDSFRKATFKRTFPYTFQSLS